MTPVKRIPLRIVADDPGPRLSYVLDILFRDLLDHDYMMAEGEGDLTYSRTAPASGIHIPCSGFLSETGMHDDLPFPTDLLTHDNHSTVDLFAWTFYHLSLLPLTQGLAAPIPTHALWVEDVAALLADRLDLKVSQRNFSYEITIDVDNPWKYRYKPAFVQWGGMAKDLLKGNWAGLGERRRALFSKDDPFDTDALVRKLCPADKTTLFYLVDGDHPNDSRFSLRIPAYADRVKAFQAAGYGAGIHPSYDSHNDADLTASQKVLLEGVVGPVSLSRQHYLCYTLPETFRTLLELGIQREYSLCPKDFTGPLSRIARPYPWYDLEADAVTDLVLVPAVVMDRSLQQYLGLSPVDAIIAIRSQIQAVRQRKGHFVIILHNETFSESGEWKGWLPVIEAMLDDLKGNGS